MNPLNTNSSGEARPTLMVAHAIIPMNLTREDYIKTVFQTNQITVVTKNGAYINRVFVPKNQIDYIVFPQDKLSLGSPVIIGNISPDNFPVVIAIMQISDELSLVENEGMFQITKKTKNGVVTIAGDANDNEILISTTGTNKPAKILLSAIDKELKSECNINIAGNILTDASNHIFVSRNQFFLQVRKDTKEDTKETYFSITVEKGLAYLDEYENSFNIQEEAISIKSAKKGMIQIDEKVHLGDLDGEEPILLGDKTKDVLSDMLSVLETLNNALTTYSQTQATASSPSPLTPLSTGYIALTTQINSLKTKISQIKTSLNTIQSKNSFSN